MFALSWLVPDRGMAWAINRKICLLQFKRAFMKLPRWLVLAMLAASVLAPTTAAGWWWVTWPTRTIREFTELLEQGRFEEANHFLKPPSRLRIEAMETRDIVVVEGGQRMTFRMQPVLFSPESWQSWCTLENLEIESRSVGQFIQGHQQFSFHRMFTTPVFIGGYAERGAIQLRYEEWAVSPP